MLAPKNLEHATGIDSLAGLAGQHPIQAQKGSIRWKGIMKAEQVGNEKTEPATFTVEAMSAETPVPMRARSPCGL